MHIGPVNLTWWRKRPSVHVANVPLRAEDLPWFVDERKGLGPFLASGITFPAPGEYPPPLPPMVVRISQSMQGESDFWAKNFHGDYLTPYENPHEHAVKRHAAKRKLRGNWPTDPKDFFDRV